MIDDAKLKQLFVSISNFRCSLLLHIARPGPAEHKGSIGIVPTYFCRKIPKELHLKVLFEKHPSDLRDDKHFTSRLLYFCPLFYDN